MLLYSFSLVMIIPDVLVVLIMLMEVLRALDVCEVFIPTLRGRGRGTRDNPSTTRHNTKKHNYKGTE